jgi:hypothetical protein
MLGTNIDNPMGDCRKMHNDDLHSVTTTMINIRLTSCAGNVALVRRAVNSYKNAVGKREEKRLLGKSEGL